MLNNVGKYVIIRSEMRWERMNNNVLISTAMLSSFWEKRQKDTLDLLIPFFEYAINKTTRVDGKINISKISDVLKTDFGYASMPNLVINKILKRLSPDSLKKEKQDFYLLKSFDDDVNKFQKSKTEFKERMHRVGEALSSYLNQNVKKENFNEEQALSVLLNFFTEKGICIVSKTEDLNFYSMKNNVVNYNIAQFILKEYEEDSTIFSYLKEMVKGFFVSTAIFMQPDSDVVQKAKFKNFKCYLDTTIIIHALGLQREEEKKNAQDLIDMIVSAGGEVCCFSHTVEEIRGIIKAYRTSCKYGAAPGRETLQHWDEVNYTINDVDRYLVRLENLIKNIRITIVEGYRLEDNPSSEASSLEEQIESKIPYTNVSALKADVRSIMSIVNMRNGHNSREIEKCKHLFITSNINLSKAISDFYNDENRYVCPCMNDMDFSAIVWLKNYSVKKDYPIAKLVENAFSSTDMPPNLLLTFLETIKKMESEGDLTLEEAAILRGDYYLKRETMREINGDENAFNSEIILSAKEKLKDMYAEEERKKTLEIQAKYEAQKDKQNMVYNNAIKEINYAGSEKERTIKKIGKIISWVVVIVLAIFFLAISLFDGFKGVQNFDSAFIIKLVISTVGFIGSWGLFFGLRKTIFNKIDSYAKKKKNKEMEKKRIEYKKLFNNEELDNLNIE